MAWVVDLDDIGLVGMFVYDMVHSPVCRIVQMWNSANTDAGTKHIWVACFLPRAHLDYIFRDSLDFLG